MEAVADERTDRRGALGSVVDDGTARVHHTEDVYPDVVAERAAVLAGLGCATSAALLVPATGGDLLTGQVERACGVLGPPGLSTADAAGRRHDLWVVPAGPLQRRLLAAVAGADLLVADGNHRVAAAAAAGATCSAGAGVAVAADVDGAVAPACRAVAGEGAGAVIRRRARYRTTAATTQAPTHAQ